MRALGFERFTALVAALLTRQATALGLGSNLTLHDDRGKDGGIDAELVIPPRQPALELGRAWFSGRRTVFERKWRSSGSLAPASILAQSQRIQGDIDRYFTGGSALSAGYLRLRRSDDIDIFIQEGVDRVPELLGPLGADLRTAGIMVVGAESRSPTHARLTLRLGADECKLDLVIDSQRHFGTFEDYHGVRLDSAINIAVNKLECLHGRLRAKDYLDFFLLVRRRGLDFDEVLALLQTRTRIDLLTLAKNLRVPLVDPSLDLLVQVDEEEMRSFYGDLFARLVRRSRESGNEGV